jgi:hypothetical protein
MKVLMLNTFDDVAGADRAAGRLQRGLRALGIDASLLVQFKFNGQSDAICLVHRESGYLAQPYDVEDLARGICWVVEDEDRHAQLCRTARSKVEREFSIEKVSQRYAALYRELLAGK